MIKTILALFLMAHGLVHLLWFVVPWGLMEVDGLPYSTTILAGRIDLGTGGIRVYGLLWAAVAIGFVLAGAALIFSAPWWYTVTLAAAVFSFILCILGLPVAKYGALIDAALVAFLLLGSQYSGTYAPYYPLR